MKIIVGLGNPTPEYAKTKHNVGFMLADRLAKEISAENWHEKFNALVAESFFDGEKILIVKPQTFMNLSGEAVQQFVHYYKVDPAEELILIYDDIDLEPGQIRIRQKGSAGSHNGMKSVISCLGTTSFTRVRVGVGAKPEGWDLADYVLSRPGTEERKLIDEAVGRAADAVEMIVSGETEKAMSLYNGKT